MTKRATGVRRYRTKPQCKFRHLLEQHGLGERLFERVGEHLQQKGLRLNTGTIVDATIINVPSSTKNARHERDPEMHQTRKGKQWYFGMKAHVGWTVRPS
jgi:IS5 family transposase